MSQALVLSPHCDDGPLSIGASLVNQYLGQMPSVCIIFSLSCYTKDQECTGCMEDVTALRRTEEISASRIGMYTPEFLDFPEPFVRQGFSDLEDICDPSRPVTDDVAWPGVCGAVGSLLDRHRGLTLAPLGCGDHIDHRIIHHSVLSYLINHPDFPIAFYEDLPYSAHLAESELLSKVPRLPGFDFRPVLIESGLELKMAMLEVYVSQLRKEQTNAVITHWERTGGERLWFSERAFATDFSALNRS